MEVAFPSHATHSATSDEECTGTQTAITLLHPFPAKENLVSSTENACIFNKENHEEALLSKRKDDATEIRNSIRLVARGQGRRQQILRQQNKAVKKRKPSTITQIDLGTAVEHWPLSSPDVDNSARERIRDLDYPQRPVQQELAEFVQSNNQKFAVRLNEEDSPRQWDSMSQEGNDTLLQQTTDSISRDLLSTNMEGNRSSSKTSSESCYPFQAPVCEINCAEKHGLCSQSRFLQLAYVVDGESGKIAKGGESGEFAEAGNDAVFVRGLHTNPAATTNVSSSRCEQTKPTENIPKSTVSIGLIAVPMLLKPTFSSPGQKPDNGSAHTCTGIHQVEDKLGAPSGRAQNTGKPSYLEPFCLVDEPDDSADREKPDWKSKPQTPKFRLLYANRYETWKYAIFWPWWFCFGFSAQKNTSTMVQKKSVGAVQTH